MGKFNNYGSYIGTQNGDAGSFNNVDCIIGEQVVNNSSPHGGKKRKEDGKDWESFEKRMRELEARMRELKKRGGL